ncbi:hypothetical protein A2U01_0072182, partial [Trifolium medium]|nr:hypothetical protein [Trifolium medium]
RCFEAAAKNLNTVVTPKKKEVEQKKFPGVHAIGTSNPVDLDARLTKKEHKEEKQKDLPLAEKKVYA